MYFTTKLIRFQFEYRHGIKHFIIKRPIAFTRGLFHKQTEPVHFFFAIRDYADLSRTYNAFKGSGIIYTSPSSLKPTLQHEQLLMTSVIWLISVISLSVLLILPPLFSTKIIKYNRKRKFLYPAPPRPYDRQRLKTAG